MADSTQNTGGSNASKTAKDLREEIRQTLKLQGDYNNELKQSIQDLDRQIKQYQTINAKLATLEKSSINIKELNRDITKQRQKDFTTATKLRDLEAEIGKQGIENAESYLELLGKRAASQKGYELAQKSGNKALEETLLTQLTYYEQQVLEGENLLGIRGLAYAATLKEQKLNDEILKALKKQLNIEKSVSKQMGITGNLVKAFSEKLGIGEKTYEDMVLQARRLNEITEKLPIGVKQAVRAFSPLIVSLRGLGSMIGQGVRNLFDPAMFIPIVGGLVSGLKSIFDYILGIQDKTVKFGRALGISTAEAENLRKSYADINISNGDLLVNTEKLMESQVEMVTLLGVQNKLTREQLATNIRLKELVGLDEESRANIARSSIITNKTEESITNSILAQVVGLKNATGISFSYKQILGEVSKLGGYLGFEFAQYPGKLTKALVTVKAFGLELGQLNAMADSFLDFESSISKEFEAQVLTGKELNLTKAREAFLNNDLATAAAEITKNVGDSLQFSKMNRIQQDSIAAAVGMSRDAVADMLKSQMFLDKLGAKDTATSVEKLRLAKERFKTEKEINAQLGEGAYQNLVAMSASEKIAAFIEKIKVAFADFVTSSGIVEKLTTLMDKLSNPDNIRKVLMMVRDFAATFVHVIGVLVNGMAKIGNFFGVISNEGKSDIRDFFDNAESGIRSMGGGVEATAGVNTNQLASQRVTQTVPAAAAAPAGRYIVSTPVTVEHKMDAYAIGKTTLNIVTQIPQM